MARRDGALPAPAEIDPIDVRDTLRAAGLRARHSLSQNFLADADVLSRILAEAGPEPGSGVLEIGPGLGLLTGGLLASGAAVTAVELDTGLAAFVRDRYSPEVAERIAAPPGKMSYLSVFVQYHARVRVAFLVPPEAFEPEPAVDSAVIVVEPYAADDRLTVDEEDELWRLVQAAFRERRKMLHNVLARQLPFDAARVDAALAAAGIAPDRRPQTVDVGEWLALREALGPLPADRRGQRGS